MKVPASPGQLILDDVAMRLRPMLQADDFVKLCQARNLQVSAELLRSLEELRLFAPIFRITGPEDEDLVLRFDGSPTVDAFNEGLIEDPSAPGAEHAVPAVDDSTSMAFYSEFQIWPLERLLSETTVTFQIHDLLGPLADQDRWSLQHPQLQARLAAAVGNLRGHQLMTATAILCQAISNRYLPYALGNQRTIRVGGASHFGQWMQFGSSSWDWDNYCHEWDPARMTDCFNLSESSLERAIGRVVVTMRGVDPLWEWRELIQFVNQDKRDQLKADALRADLYRQMAVMLIRLHRDLFRVDLGPPGTHFGWNSPRVPEPEVREDPREYLQYIVNQFDLNPQPKAVLFVEGRTELNFVKSWFQGYWGGHHGISEIELVELQGVDQATGNKTSDRFNAIFRLIDYLHDHQSLAFLMLDNEGQAGNLPVAAKTKHSTFEGRTWVTPPDQIKVWEKNFELDNFEDPEIALALTACASDEVRFRVEDVAAVRVGGRKASIAKLFQERTSRGLDKPMLGEHLAEIASENDRMEDGTPRPVVEFLVRVTNEAARNPLPTMKESWRHNQEYMDSQGR